nr:unnamed protein product [Callosobruchus chinensis]
MIIVLGQYLVILLIDVYAALFI